MLHACSLAKISDRVPAADVSESVPPLELPSTRFSACEPAPPREYRRSGSDEGFRESPSSSGFVQATQAMRTEDRQGDDESSCGTQLVCSRASTTPLRCGLLHHFLHLSSGICHHNSYDLQLYSGVRSCMSQSSGRRNPCTGHTPFDARRGIGGCAGLCVTTAI